MILGVAAGEIPEDSLARWISSNVKTMKAPGI
jgi:hypothetical protein